MGIGILKTLSPNPDRDGGEIGCRKCFLFVRAKLILSLGLLIMALQMKYNRYIYALKIFLP